MQDLNKLPDGYVVEKEEVDEAFETFNEEVARKKKEEEEEKKRKEAEEEAQDKEGEHEEFEGFY